MKVKLFLFPVLLLCASSHQGGAATTSGLIRTGLYNGSLFIGYDQAKAMIQGGFYETRGEGEQFSCIFLFKGHEAPGSTVSLQAYIPGFSQKDFPPIKGQLILGADNTLTIKLRENPAGCDVEGSDFTGKTDSLATNYNFSKAYPWKRIAMIKNKRAYFFRDNAGKFVGKAYLVESDIVGVREQKGGMSLVDYIVGKKPVSAWMKSSDLY